MKPEGGVGERALLVRGLHEQDVETLPNRGQCGNPERGRMGGMGEGDEAGREVRVS